MFSNWIQSVCCRIIVLGVCLLYMLSASAALAEPNQCTTEAKPLPNCLDSMNWEGSCQCPINLNDAPTYVTTMPASRTTGANLTLVNNFFHRVYEYRICQIIQKVGKNGGNDVLLMMGDKLVLYSNNQRQAIAKPLIPELYHKMKTIGHQPFALVLILGEQDSQVILTKRTSKYLNEQKKNIEQLQKKIETEIGGWSNIEETLLGKIILTKTKDKINNILSAGSIPNNIGVEIRQEIIPEVVKAVDISAALELMNLNSKVTQLLKARQATSPSNELYVVIGSGSQPHFREVSLQYFSQVFNEIPGYDHFLDDHIIYAEGQYREIDLLSTLARHILDREASEALFRSPNRLQEDILSDSATKWLWENQTDIPRIKQ